MPLVRVPVKPPFDEITTNNGRSKKVGRAFFFVCDRSIATKKKKNGDDAHTPPPIRGGACPSLSPATMPLPLPLLLAAAAVAVLAAVAAVVRARAAARPFLDPTVFKPLRLAERVELTHNTRLFR